MPMPEHLAQKIGALLGKARLRCHILDLSGVSDVEYTALTMLTETEKRQRKLAISLWLVGLTPRYSKMVQLPLNEAIGPESIHFSLEMAVAKYVRSSPSTNAHCLGAIRLRNAGFMIAYE